MKTALPIMLAVIALPIVAGSATYLTWMREETRRADGAS